ncbi:unnamed protein product [Rotaria socialis]|uniref:RGS domain-containing protein n=3 Tax=Rotaria socialis TaxID=392032 RepID=A0A819ZJE0_9BILA|nr:unnamed protein product [Rotaria socialis]
MQQSPSISVEHESSPKTISHNSSVNSLHKNNKLRKWCQIVRRVVQFFRFIKIPQLRLRFIDMLNHLSTVNFEIEGSHAYKIDRVQEDLLFLDDVKNYQEVFNTFSSCGFVWQDREFHMAKLKGNYIYDHYMSTSEAVAKTNIPIDTIPSISNRIASPKTLPSITYLNLFNHAEKFIIEKLLLIYLREGLNCFSLLSHKQSIVVLNRYKRNQIKNESILSFENLKHMSKIEKSLSKRSKIKCKDKLEIQSQHDELIIPNWTYSTDLGVIYNPIRQKRVKVIKKNTRKKKKETDSIVKLDHSTPNQTKVFDSNVSTAIIPVTSNILSCTYQQQPIHKNVVPLISKNKTLLPCYRNQNRFSSLNYYRCGNVFNKNISDKQQYSQTIFICKAHSLSWPESYTLQVEHETPYRII